EARDADEACRLAATALGDDRSDVPFALLYLLEPTGRRARLAARTGLPAGHALAPESVDLTAPPDGPDTPWPLADVAGTAVPQLVQTGEMDFASLPTPQGAPAPRSAFVLPVARAVDARPA